MEKYDISNSSVKMSVIAPGMLKKNLIGSFEIKVIHLCQYLKLVWFWYLIIESDQNLTQHFLKFWS